MKNKMFLIIGAILILFVALYFVNDYKEEKEVKKNEETIKEKTKDTDNPYGKTTLATETIEQLDDPLYQNQIVPVDLDKELENEEDLTVYFYKADCPHCHEATPKLIPAAKELDVDVKKLNLLEFNQSEYWKRYFIESTPTLVYYNDGIEEARIEGVHSEEEYKDFLNKNAVTKKEK